MTIEISFRQLVLLALAIALVVATVVVVTLSFTGGGADSPTGELMAKGVIPWAI